MIHTRLQLDPGANVTVRDGKDGAYEIAIFDTQGDASAVIELSAEQLVAIGKVTRDW